MLSQNNEILTDVSFYTCTDNVNYIIRIYDRFENGELQDELSNTSGTIDHLGFYTVELNQPVYLAAGDQFYIYLELSDGGLPYDRTIELDYWWSGEITIESVSHPDESYYYDKGSWHDLYDFDNTANFCIKGLISKTSDLECDEKINWVDIKPGATVTYNISIKNVGESFSKLDWEIVEYPSWGTWTFTPEEGCDLIPEQGPVTIQVSVVAPRNKNKQLSGEIKIINNIDSSDYEIIQVSLTTPKAKPYINTPFMQFLEQYPILYQLLQRFLQI